MQLDILKHLVGDNYRVVILPSDDVYIEVNSNHQFYFDVPDSFILDKDEYYLFKKLSATSLIKELFSAC